MYAGSMSTYLPAYIWPNKFNSHTDTQAERQGTKSKAKLIQLALKALSSTHTERNKAKTMLYLIYNANSEFLTGPRP